MEWIAYQVVHLVEMFPWLIIFQFSPPVSTVPLFLLVFSILVLSTASVNFLLLANQVVFCSFSLSLLTQVPLFLCPSALHLNPHCLSFLSSSCILNPLALFSLPIISLLLLLILLFLVSLLLLSLLLSLFYTLLSFSLLFLSPVLPTSPAQILLVCFCPSHWLLISIL